MAGLLFAFLAVGCREKPSVADSKNKSATEAPAIQAKPEPERVAAVAWTVKPGPAEPKDAAPSESRPPATLTMRKLETGEYHFALSSPRLDGTSTLEGDVLRVALTGKQYEKDHGDSEGDGTLLLRKEGETFRGTLRASPALGKTTLQAEVLLVAQSRAP